MYGHPDGVERVVRRREQFAHCLIAIEHLAFRVRAGSEEHRYLTAILSLPSQLLGGALKHGVEVFADDLSALL